MRNPLSIVIISVIVIGLAAGLLAGGCTRALVEF
jgi:hypothetical protein